MARCKDCRGYNECKKIPYPDGVYPDDVNDVEICCDGYYPKKERKNMAKCKDCEYFEDCIKLGKEHWEDYPYSDVVNNVEELCGGFEIKTEREKDMVSCKDCANGEVCGDVMERDAELCEVFVDKPSAKGKYIKQVYGEPSFGNVAPSAEWKKKKETEETTLKIKASVYDAIKDIVAQHQKLKMSNDSAMNHICGAIIAEQFVTKSLMK